MDKLDLEYPVQGWTEDQKQQWRIEYLLRLEIRTAQATNKLLEQILARLPPPPQYPKTTGIVVIVP
jgi:hypothetical protein